MRSKELRAKRAKLIEDARALISGESPTAELNAKYDAMMDEADALKAQIDRIEKADTEFAATQEALQARGQRARPGAPASEDQELEHSTFMAWVRGGPNSLSADQRAVYERRFMAADGTTPDTSGGYVVGQDNSFLTRIVDAQKAYGGMLDPTVTYIFDTTGAQPLPVPTDNDTTNSGARLAQNTQVTGQDITFGQVMFNGYTYTSKLVLVSNQLLRDAAFDLEPWLATKLGIRIARAVNTDLTVAAGASSPTGVTVAATKGYDAGGSTSSGSTATIIEDDLLELEHSVDPAYRRNARFMMSDAALKVIKKLKDGMGRPLWLSGIAVKEPDTINGYPYTINQDMAAPAASAISMLFGDFTNYYVRRIAGTRVIRLSERYADSNQVGFLAFQDWDGNLVDAGTHPIKYLKQSAT